MKQIGFQPIKRKKKSVYPNQYLITKIGNGIICNGNFYPFYKSSIYNMQLLGLDPAPPGKRIYVDNITLSVAKAHIDVTKQDFRIFSYVNGVRVYLAYVRFPITTTADMLCYVFDLDCGFLLDPLVRIEDSPDTADITYYENIKYAIIDALPGEKNPKVIEE